MRRSLLILALAVAVAATSLAAAKNTGWRFEHVGNARGYYNWSAVAGNRAGRRVAVWGSAHGLSVAVARPGHGFRRPHLVKREKFGADSPGVVVNGRGDALLVWSYLDGTYFADPSSRDEDCCFGERVAVLHANGHLSRVHTLTPRGLSVSLEAWAIGRHGRFGVVWEEYGPGTNGVLGRFSTRHGLGRTRRIDPHGTGVDLYFAHGRAHVLLLATRHGHSWLAERVRHSNGAFGPRRTVARGLPPEPDLTVLSNERGQEVVAWTRDGFGRRRVRAGVRSPGARLETRFVGFTNVEFSAPWADIAPSGAAAIAWADREVLLSTTSGPGHPFGRAKYVLHPHKGAHRDHVEDQIALAVNSHEEALVSWITSQDFALHAAARTTSGHTTRRAILDHGLPDQVSATLDDRGRATVVWDGAHHHIEAAYASTLR